MNPMMPPMGAPGPMGMPPPPPQPPSKEQLAMLDKPSWQEVIGLLKNKVHRSYRIDIETDSTIAGSLESDMQGLSQIMQAVSGFMRETAPLVQGGQMPVEAQKEILNTITRRARMGMAVEDALDKMQGPNPQQPKEDPAIAVQKMKTEADAQKFQAQQQADQQKMQMQAQINDRDRQAEVQAEQMRMQMDAQLEQQKMQAARDKEMAQMQADERVAQTQMQAEMQIEQNRMALAAQLEQVKASAKADSERQQQAFDAQMAQFQAQQKASVDVLLAHIKKDQAVEVAQIGAASVMSAAQDAAANTEAESE